MTAPLRIGIAGLGTVGAEVARLLRTHDKDIARACGRQIILTAVSARDSKRDRGIDLSGVTFHADAKALVDDPAVDCVVELIGGAEGAAWDVVSRALDTQKPVVTANKALLALRSSDVLSRIKSAAVPLLFEAAVAGGIPAIKTLREGLAANTVTAVYGILNGTCNYILSEMETGGKAFADVLSDAQRLGYAEADPAFDIDGHDASHKLAILSALAFGGEPNVKNIAVSGIRRVSSLDVSFAHELGYRIRLLGVARMTDAGVAQSVEACLVPEHLSLARIDGPLNAVYFDTDYAGKILLTGAGAGGKATASAVVADIIDLARGRALPDLFTSGNSVSHAPIAERRGRFYMRLQVTDQPGVIADVSAILRDVGVSLETVLQRGRDPGQEVSVILTTHETRQGDIELAAARIAALPALREPPHVMRIETLS